MITLEQALTLIRQLQPKCMANGWYLALAGGVLNAGYSLTDVDLVAMPMTAHSNLQSVLAVLNENMVLERTDIVPKATHFVFSHSICKVEVSIVT